MMIRKSISLSINPSFYFLAFLVAWMNGATPLFFAAWIVVVTVSVIVHELGHALTLVFFGQKAKIELGGMGGLTIWQGGALSRGKEFLVVLMGPIFGLFLCALFSFILASGVVQGNLYQFFLIMVWANLFWSVLNLLPMYPLDGGKLMTIILDLFFGGRGVQFSYLLGTIFAIGCAAFALFSGMMILGLFALLCAFESLRNWKNGRMYRLEREGSQVFDEISEAERNWAASKPEEAIRLLEKVISQQENGEGFFRAIDLLSSCLLSSGQTKKAYALLQPVKKRLLHPTLKQFQLACYKLGNWEEALETGKKIFLEEQDLSCAILNAFSSAHLSQVEAVVNWMSYVKKTGGVSMSSLLSSNDFDEIRSCPLFQQFVGKCLKDESI